MPAVRLSSLAVQIEAIGADKVKSALREVGGEAERTSTHLATHYGKAARSLSLVTNEAIRAGEVGGNALQKILTVGGDIAGMFGATGAIVGAVAIAGLAIYNYFDRAQKKIEEMAKAARAELRSLRDAAAGSAAEQLGRITSGDVLSDKPVERLSKTQLESSAARLKHGLDIGVDERTEQEVKDKLTLKDVNDELERRNDTLKRGLPLIIATAEAEARRTIEEGKKGVQSEADQAFTRRLAVIKEKGDAAIANVNRTLKAQDDAYELRLKNGMLLAGDLPALPLENQASIDAYLKKGVLDALAKIHAAAKGIAYESIDKQTEQHLTMNDEQYGQAISQGTEGLSSGLQQHLDEMADDYRNRITHTLGDAIYEGFAAAFSGKGLGGVFKAFGKTILGGLGQIISEQGMIYLEYSGIMQAFTPLLGNPFTAGFAGAAIGAALIALGAALGAAAQGGGHSHASASIPRPAEITTVKLTATSVADQARYDPRSTGNNYYVIGTDDPKAQRELRSMVEKGGRRA